MMVVAGSAVIYWRRASGLQFRWFWAGASLWAVAVVLKALFSMLLDGIILACIGTHVQSRVSFVLAGGLYLGFRSSLFEMGLTFLAVLLWRQLGRDANRAIGIGMGAGAFEALVLGIGSFAGIMALLDRLPGTEPFREAIETAATVTPVFWLASPVERALALVTHASSRTLVLLGVTRRKPMMIFWGFLIFALLDSVGGAALATGKMGKISTWWTDLAILPFALISIAILRWCHRRRSGTGASIESPRRTLEKTNVASTM